MKAIVLAAGRGSRMQHHTEDRPKCLVELNRAPLLEWQLRAIRQAGIEDIGIVTGYRRDQLANRGLREFHNPRWEETNMVHSLRQAAPWLESDTCIISYSDIFYEASAISLLLDSEADLAITYDPDWLRLWRLRFDNPLEDAETFVLNPDSTLADIGGKPQSLGEIQGQYMGLLRFTPKGWRSALRVMDALPPSRQDRLDMTGMLQRLITGKDISIKATPYRGVWGEVDSAHDLLVYQRMFDVRRPG
jgi:choline kinase